MNILQDLLDSLIVSLVKCKAPSDSNQNVIKQYTEKLSQNGDLGFPLQTKAWLPIVKDAGQLKSYQIFEEEDTEFQNSLVRRSEQWSLKIDKIVCLPERCLVFLSRNDCFYKVMKAVLSEGTNYGKSSREDGKMVRIDVDASNADELTQHRCVLVKSVLVNLLDGYSKYEMTKEKGVKAVDVFVCHPKSRPKSLPKNSSPEEKNNNNNNAEFRPVVVGAISFGKQGDKITALEYIGKRTSDMKKMAQLKYGNDKDDMALYDFEKLGRAVATFDLLKVKHTNPIPIANLIEQSCATKGAIFVLYNVARVQTVLNTFNEKVAQGYYKPLPDFEQIDVSTLREEEEWQLLYVYILGFPSLLERCTRQIDSGLLAIHSLCNFLSSFISLFSVYYHRVKILTNNQPQLVDTMNARVYLLMCIRQVLTTSLNLLNIDPLDQM